MQTQTVRGWFRMRSGVVGLFLCAGLFSLPPALCAQTKTNVFEAEIRNFELADANRPPATNAVLFVGSSSIRLWEGLPQDFAPTPVLQRGFGGSHLADVIEFTDRIVLPYQPRLILLYAGDNDLNAGKPPAQVFADFKTFVAKVHARLPRARIAFISIKPSPSRWHLVEQVKSANKLIRDFTKSDRRLEFIDVFNPMLDKQGQVRGELFGPDALHLNRQGYELWRDVIKPHLKP